MTRSARQKEYYQENREKIIKKTNEWCAKNREKSNEIKAKYKKRKIKEAKEFVNSVKDKCSICGITDKVCLEFHHIGEKKYLIAKMVADGYTIESIQKEIEQCEVICANCHRLEHYPYDEYRTTSLKINIVIDYKSNNPCVICGEDNPFCLDLHHKQNEEKVLNLGKMVRSKGYTVEDVQDEINKCECLCVNCHRKEHEHDDWTHAT